MNYCDPSGHFGFWAAALIGVGVFALVGALATMHADIADDGELFNGSIGADAYFWNTLVAGSIGGLAGGLIFTFAPTITGFLGSSFTLGSYALASGEVAAITVSGVQLVAGAIGIIISLFSLSADRYKRKNTGSNTSQNKFIDHLHNKYGFSDKVRRRLHDIITKRGYSNQKVEEILRKMMGLD